MKPEIPETPSSRLEGRRALVTGAGRGLGLAAAAALARAGADVVLASRSQDEIEAVAALLRDEGWRATSIVMDVTDIVATGAAIDALGPFNILVNNAGMNRPKRLEDVTEGDFDAIFALNVKAAFFVAQAVARGLVTADLPGSIINVSSQMGHVGARDRSVYCASKHAMEGFTKAMAIELGSRQIRVNTICPTFIETPMTAPFLADERFRAETLAKIKLGRFGRTQDIMGAILFLASDASAMITGSAIKVDGGWTAE